MTNESNTPEVVPVASQHEVVMPGGDVSAASTEVAEPGAEGAPVEQGETNIVAQPGSEVNVDQTAPAPAPAEGGQE